MIYINMGNICAKICAIRNHWQKSSLSQKIVIEEQYTQSISISRPLLDLSSDVIKKTNTGFKSTHLELLVFHSNDSYTVLHNKEKNKITLVSSTKNDKIILILNIPRITNRITQLYYVLEDLVILAGDTVLYDNDFLLSFKGNQDLKLSNIEAKDRLYFHFTPI